MACVTPEDVMNTVDSIMLRPWDWARGRHCLGDVADVVVALGGPDIMDRLRGRYKTEMGAARIVQWAGGLAVLLADEAQATGLVWGDARPGAVTVVNNTVAICVEPGRWIGKTKDGYAVIEAEMEGWSWLS